MRSSSRDFSAAVLAILFATLILAPARARAADNRVNVVLDCQCKDEVGADVCDDLKDQILKAPLYHFQDLPREYGMQIHVSCTDLLAGIKGAPAAHMSAIALVFTIYAEDLPGEVYLDSSVTRVGGDAISDLSGKILDATAQQVKANAKFFDRERQVVAYKAGVTPTPSPSEEASPSPSASASP